MNYLNNQLNSFNNDSLYVSKFNSKRGSQVSNIVLKVGDKGDISSLLQVGEGDGKFTSHVFKKSIIISEKGVNTVNTENEKGVNTVNTGNTVNTENENMRKSVMLLSPNQNPPKKHPVKKGPILTPIKGLANHLKTPNKQINFTHLDLSSVKQKLFTSPTFKLRVKKMSEYGRKKNFKKKDLSALNFTAVEVDNNNTNNNTTNNNEEHSSKNPYFEELNMFDQTVYVKNSLLPKMKNNLDSCNGKNIMNSKTNINTPDNNSINNITKSHDHFLIKNRGNIPIHSILGEERRSLLDSECECEYNIKIVEKDNEFVYSLVSRSKKPNKLKMASSRYNNKQIIPGSYKSNVPNANYFAYAKDGDFFRKVNEYIHRKNEKKNRTQMNYFRQKREEGLFFSLVDHFEVADKRE